MLNKLIDLNKLKTENLLNLLPENMQIYKDSGRWNITDHEDEDDFYHSYQKLNETFKDFIIRTLKEMIKYKDYKESIESKIACFISNVGSFE